MHVWLYWAQVNKTAGGGVGLGDGLGGLRKPLYETILYVMAAEWHEQADSGKLVMFNCSSSSSGCCSLCQAGACKRNRMNARPRIVMCADSR
jgi:hypothetical protein